MAALLLLAPVFRGGNRQVAMSALLALGLAMLAVLLANRSFRWLPLGSADRPEVGGVDTSQPAWWWALIFLVAFSPLWISALQLIPLDAQTWTGLDGRAGYLEALRSAGAAAPTSLPLTLHPLATWTAMWSALPLIAVLLAALTLTDDAIEKLLGLLILVAIVQAVIGLFQLVQGGNSFFYFGSRSPGGVMGTFNNRNHLADLLAMLIPVWFHFLLRQQRNGSSRVTSSSRLTHAALQPLWIFLGFAFLVLILSTQSRGGLFASVFVMMISSIIYLGGLGGRISWRHRLVMLLVLAVFAIGALASVGLEGIGSRLEGDRLKSDAETRNAFAESTFLAARQFWPWGSGVGSYESVFPRFQEMLSTGFVEYAHNDYPQLLMELGAPVLLVIGALIFLVLLQIFRLFKARRRQGRLPVNISLRWFSGIGALALLLHSWVEFNMHIPALAITATFLLGIFLRPLDHRDSDD